MFARKTVLFVEWTKLPQHLKDELSRWHLFGNDRALLLQTSYRLGEGEQTPAQMLRPENFTSLYESVVKEDGFVGSFETFLKRYALSTHHWLATSGQDFTGIDEVYLDICW